MPGLVSIVIVTFNRLEKLQKAIESIRGHCTQVAEIIVVDNASTDGTPEWVLQQADIKLVRSRKNFGPGPGRNSGVKIANSVNIFFLDDDAYLIDDVIVPGLKLMKENPTAGCIAYPIFEKRQNKLIYGANPGKSKCFAAGAALFKKKALLAAGLFDENIKWSEEFDLSIGLYTEGYKIFTIESPYVMHDSTTFPIQHSLQKLRNIAYGRFRSILKRFSFWNAFIMSLRVAFSIGWAGLKAGYYTPVILAAWDIILTWPDISNNRKVVPVEVERFFTEPNYLEDEFSVSITQKVVNKIFGK